MSRLKIVSGLPYRIVIESWNTHASSSSQEAFLWKAAARGSKEKRERSQSVPLTLPASYSLFLEIFSYTTAFLNPPLPLGNPISPPDQPHLLQSCRVTDTEHSEHFDSDTAYQPLPFPVPFPGPTPPSHNAWTRNNLMIQVLKISVPQQRPIFVQQNNRF